MSIFQSVLQICTANPPKHHNLKVTMDELGGEIQVEEEEKVQEQEEKASPLVH